MKHLVPAVRPNDVLHWREHCPVDDHACFPFMARHLAFGDCEIKGIDLIQHDKPERYREVVGSSRTTPLPWCACHDPQDRSSSCNA